MHTSDIRSVETLNLLMISGASDLTNGWPATTTTLQRTQIPANPTPRISTRHETCTSTCTLQTSSTHLQRSRLQAVKNRSKRTPSHAVVVDPIVKCKKPAQTGFNFYRSARHTACICCVCCGAHAADSSGAANSGLRGASSSAIPHFSCHDSEYLPCV